MIANVRVIPEGALFLIGGVNFLSFSASGLLSEPLKFSDDVEIPNMDWILLLLVLPVDDLAIPLLTFDTILVDIFLVLYQGLVLLDDQLHVVVSCSAIFSSSSSC